MTLTELFTQGHDRVRLPTWHEKAYLRFTGIAVTPDGTRSHGPWIDLHDPTIPVVFPDDPVPKRLLLYQIDQPERTDWEPYTGPLWHEEG